MAAVPILVSYLPTRNKKIRYSPSKSWNGTRLRVSSGHQSGYFGERVDITTLNILIRDLITLRWLTGDQFPKGPENVLGPGKP